MNNTKGEARYELKDNRAGRDPFGRPWMSEFPTFDRLAEEFREDQAAAQQKRPKRRTDLILLAVVLLAAGIDYVIFGARASRTQAQIEQTLKATPLPPDTVQVDYHSGHWTHKGYAARTLASAKSPRELCDFYLPKLEEDAWLVEDEDCLTIPGRVWSYSGYDVLSLRRENTEFLLKNDGRVSGKNQYSIFLEWPD